MSTLMSYVEGYQEHLFDLRCVAVYQGFWAGYYSRSKKPKTLSSVLTSLLTEHSKATKGKKSKLKKSAADVDVEAFLSQERAFRAKLNK